MNEQEIFATVDRLFEENQPREAERFLLEQLLEARTKGENGLVLQLLNELIGFYRQTSEKDRLLDVIGETLDVAEMLQLQGSVPFATTLLNIATGFRSIGETQRALICYEQAEAIYLDNLPEDDMRMGGFYNNLSLLYEELGQYARAEETLTKALAIALKNEDGFAIAVTYANLANTCAAQEKYEKAEEYGLESIRRFKERGTLDNHYAAALSALGMCYYRQGRKEEAANRFLEAMEAVERSIGRNEQYRRLEENYKMCLEQTPVKKLMTGMELCRSYYEECAKPLLEKQFGEDVKRIAVGLVGQGSDCYGFDDSISRDHDWGPGFCMWVTKETYDRIGDRLEAFYAGLPKEFMGYRWVDSGKVSKRRGVFIIEEFYRSLLGTDYQNDRIGMSEYALSEAVNGEVFRDEEGIFTAIREKLAEGYEEKNRFLLLATDMAGFSQNAQYNYERMLTRGDLFTANMLLMQGMRDALRLWHHLANRYAPHEKWLKESTLTIEGGEELVRLVERVTSLAGSVRSLEDAQAAALPATIEEIGRLLANKAYALSDISDVDSFLAEHTDELRKKAELSVFTNEELAKKIAELEFKAFDRVQNEGGRASCQNDWPTFRVMRMSQYLTWNRTMLLQYYYDFDREFKRGHNLITEKYGRMMESTAPAEYAKIKDAFPVLTEQKLAVISQIVALQMEMVEALSEQYPGVIGNARSLHTYEDHAYNTSYETYLRGEISTYSDKMLQLYGQYVVQCISEGRNIAEETMGNTARLYGYKGIADFDASFQK